MELALTIFRASAAGQVMILAFLIVFSKNPMRVRFLGGALLMSIFWYLLAPSVYSVLEPFFGVWFMLPLALISSLMVLFVWVIFEDHLPIPAWLFAVVAFDLLVSAFYYLDLFGFGQTASSGQFTAAVKLILATIAVYIVLRSRQDDLLPRRAQLRLFLVGSIIWSNVPILAIQLLESSQLLMYANLLVACVLFFNATVILLAFIKLNPDFELTRKPQRKTGEEQDPLLDSIVEIMEEGRLYAEQNLRLNDLADRLGLSEFQLRNKINGLLGYRNFNQFVNHYRIQEACRILGQDEKPAILSLSMDVGFGSISAFNAAFRAQTNMSPSQYRESIINPG